MVDVVINWDVFGYVMVLDVKWFGFKGYWELFVKWSVGFVVYVFGF